MISKSTEDYLKRIFGLSRKLDKVTTSAIADSMSISSASVTDMIKKLSELDFLSYTPYQGVRLTKKGEKLALKVIRRHRLLELFLVEALHFSWDKVHEEADRLEHVISDEFEHGIDKYLGMPKYDPHGDPIPTLDGEMEEVDYYKLAEMEVGDTCLIIRVTDSQRLLQLMKKMDLGLNATLVIKEKEAFDGSLVVKINGKKEHFLSREVSSNIFVKKAGKT